MKYFTELVCNVYYQWYENCKEELFLVSPHLLNINIYASSLNYTLPMDVVSLRIDVQEADLFLW